MAVIFINFFQIFFLRTAFLKELYVGGPDCTWNNDTVGESVIKKGKKKGEILA